MTRLRHRSLCLRSLSGRRCSGSEAPGGARGGGRRARLPGRARGRGGAVPTPQRRSARLSRAPGSRVITTSPGNWHFGPTATHTAGSLPVANPRLVFADPRAHRAPTSCGRPTSAATSGRRSRLATPRGPASRPSPNALGPIAAARPGITPARPSAAWPCEASPSRLTPGIWSGRVPGDPAFTYQWQRCTTRPADRARASPAPRAST